MINSCRSLRTHHYLVFHRSTIKKLIFALFHSHNAVSMKNKNKVIQSTRSCFSLHHENNSVKYYVLSFINLFTIDMSLSKNEICTSDYLLLYYNKLLLNQTVLFHFTIKSLSIYLAKNHKIYCFSITNFPVSKFSKEKSRILLMSALGFRYYFSLSVFTSIPAFL